MNIKCLRAPTHELIGITQFNQTQILRPLKIQPETVVGNLPMPVKEWVRQGEEQIARGLELIHTSGPGKGLIFPDYPFLAQDILWIKATQKQRMAITEDGKDHYRYYTNTKATAKLWLEVERIETLKLHDLGNTEAVQASMLQFKDGSSYRIPLNNFGSGYFRTPSPALAAIALFNIINKVSMSDNPFVWQITIKRIEKPDQNGKI